MKRLPLQMTRDQLLRTKHLLHMLYTPVELAKEIDSSPDMIRSYILAGCPHKRGTRNRIWIVGDEFREWAWSIFGRKGPQVAPGQVHRFAVNRENYQAVQNYLAYLADVQNRSSQTIRRHRVCFRHLLEWAGAIPFVQSSEIRPSFFRYLTEHRNDRRDKPLAHKSIALALGWAREFLTWLRDTQPVKCKALDDRWLASLALPRSASRQQIERKPFTVDEIRKIVTLPADTLTDRRNQAAIAFLFLSGARVTAFVTLSLACVDILGRAVKQWPSMGVQTKYGKSATTYLLEIPDLLEVVKQWDDLARAELQPSALWFASLTPDGMALTGATKAGQWRREIVTKYLRQLCDRAGVAYRSPHNLRHGHAVYALEHASTIADLKAISQNLMHDTLGVTDALYSVLPGKDVARRIANLAQSDLDKAGGVLEEIKRLLVAHGA